MGEEVSEDAESDVPFTFAVGFEEGLATEWVGEEMAELEEIVEPCTALDSGHCGAEEIDTGDLVGFGVFFGPADIFAVGGIVGHHF